MTKTERLVLFEAYTNEPRFEYHDNGPDHWVCPVCDYRTNVIYVETGKLKPSINEIKHAPDCPQNPLNK